MSARALPAPLWILWLGGLAALGAGIFVLAMRRHLAPLYGIPRSVLAVIGVANVLYSTLGLTLVSLRTRRPALLVALVTANYGWAMVCGAFAVALGRTATVFGLAHVLGEGAFVATLATLEWRRRHALLSGHRA